MKLFVSLVVLLTISSNILFAINFKVDWKTKDVTEAHYNLWLADNDTKAISLVFLADENTGEQSSHFAYWDLATRTVEKTIPVKTEHLHIGMQYNPIDNEFFYCYRDTFKIFDGSDYSIKSEINVPDKFYFMWSFDQRTKLYNVYYTSNDTLTITQINPELKSIVKTENIIFPDFNKIYMQISDNGSYFVVHNGNNTLYVYGNSDMKLVATKSLEKFPSSFSISNSGKYIGVHTNYADSLPYRIYNLTNPEEVFYIKNKIKDFGTIKFNKQENKVLLTYTYNGQYVYNFNNPEPIKSIIGTSSSTKMTYCLNDEYLIDLGNKRLITLDKISNNEYYELSLTDRTGRNNGLQSLRFDESNENVLVSGGEGLISARDIKSGKITHSFILSRSPIKIMNSGYSEIRDTLVYITGISSSRELIFRDGVDKILDKISFDGFNVIPIAISRDKKWFVGGTYREGTFLYNLTKEPNKKFFYLDSGRLWNSGACFSSDSRYLAAGGSDNYLKIYDLQNIYADTVPKLVISYNDTLKNKEIRYIKFIDNDKKIVTMSTAYYGFRVWSAETGELIIDPKVPTQYHKDGLFTGISYIAYRPKFDDYVTVDFNGQIILWDNQFNFKALDNSPKFTSTYTIAFDYNSQLNKLVIGSQNSEIIQFDLDDYTSVESNQIEEKLVIYPNPATDYITINLDRWSPPSRWTPSEIEIYDVMGVLIQTTPSASQPPLQDRNLRIDVSNLTPGVYFVKIIGSNGACSIVEKFVKM